MARFAVFETSKLERIARNGVSPIRASLLLGVLLISMVAPLLLGKVALLVAIYMITTYGQTEPIGEVQWAKNCGIGKIQWKMLWLFLPIFILIAVSQLLYVTLLSYFNIECPEQDILKILNSLSRYNKILLIFSAVILAPITEELIFRHFLFGTMLKWSSPPVAMAFVSLLFSALHFQYGVLMGLFVCGVCWQYIYCRGGSLTTVILLHALNNGLTLAIKLALG